MAPSFDYNDQNAFRCTSLCRFVSRMGDSSQQKKNTEYNSLPQSILVIVVKFL